MAPPPPSMLRNMSVCSVELWANSKTALSLLRMNCEMVWTHRVDDYDEDDYVQGGSGRKREAIVRIRNFCNLFGCSCNNIIYENSARFRFGLNRSSRPRHHYITTPTVCTTLFYFPCGGWWVPKHHRPNKTVGFLVRQLTRMDWQHLNIKLVQHIL